VIEIVGRWSQHPDPLMHTSDAYDVAFQTLWGLLPDCDHRDKLCGWGTLEVS
jgi:hypothetical protein